MNNNSWVEERIDRLMPATDWQPDTARAWSRLRGAQAGRARRMNWGIAATLACATALAFPQPRAITQRICSACLTAAQSFVSLEPARRRAPDFTLSDASGQPVTLSSLRGKVVMLNFWATWCPPCKMEIPWLMEFQRTYRDRGFVVVGLSMDEDGWDAVKPFMERMKINYPMVIGNDEVATLFGGVESLPTTLLIDREGRIAFAHTGLVSKADYQAGIEGLLKR